MRNLDINVYILVILWQKSYKGIPVRLWVLLWLFNTPATSITLPNTVPISLHFLFSINLSFLLEGLSSVVSFFKRGWCDFHKLDISSALSNALIFFGHISKKPVIKIVWWFYNEFWDVINAFLDFKHEIKNQMLLGNSRCISSSVFLRDVSD